jgi:hypothetical protein
MKASQKTLLFIAALTALPAVADAASLVDYGYSVAQSAPPTPLRAPVRRTLAQMNLEPRFYLRRPYAPPVTITPASDAPVTALSRQVAADGPIGSVGLINLAGRAALADADPGDSLASQRGLPTRALGFKVSYNFP